MTNIYGTAGKSTGERAKKIRKFTIWMAVLLMVGIVIIAIFFYANQRALGFIGGGVFTFIFGVIVLIAYKKFGKYIDKQADEARKYRQGARGEEQEKLVKSNEPIIMKLIREKLA